MAKGSRTVKKSKKRRTRQEVQTLISEVESLTKGGSPLMKALAKVGVSYSNYNYWVKKRSPKTASDTRASKVRGKRGGALSVLEAMRENRVKRQELEKAIRDLDAKFSRLKVKLNRN